MIFRGTNVFICDECVKACMETIYNYKKPERVFYQSDIFNSNHWSKGILKSSDSDISAKAFWQDGYYHLALLRTPSDNYYQWCGCSDFSLTDFRVSVEAGLDTEFIARGSEDGIYGVVFRGTASNKSYYKFAVSRSGYYSLDCWVDGKRNRILHWVYSQVIEREAKTNILTVEVIGQKITIGVNGHDLAMVTDNRKGLDCGFVGVFVQTNALNSLTEARFRKFAIYEIG